MSARNGDKSRFHRLRKAKIRRRLRTELLQSLVTTAPEHATASKAPEKAPKPAKAKTAEADAPKAEAPKAAKPKAEKLASKAPDAGAPKTKAPADEKSNPDMAQASSPEQEAPVAASDTSQGEHKSKSAESESGERPARGPLAAVAETLGSTIGNLVAKTSHPHKAAEPSEKPAE